MGLTVATHHWQQSTRVNPITITKDQVRRLSDNYRLQFGETPSQNQLDALVDAYLKEEILYREALELGLDKDDEIIRRRLVQKVEFLQQDMGAPAEPSDRELRAYYDAHLDHYRIPAKVTFTQVYFSVDTRGAEGAQEAAEALAAKLSLQGRVRAVDQQDRFPGPDDFSALSQVDLTRVFGAQGLSQDIFNVEPNHWSAPLRSGLGWHTVYVTSRQSSRQTGFEQARDAVRGDLMEEGRARRNAQAFEIVRSRFVITRE